MCVIAAAIASYIHAMFIKRNSAADACKYKLSIKVKAKLDKCVQQGRGLSVRALQSRRAEIESPSQPGLIYAVDLDNPKSCCGRSARHGLPCKHQCELIRLDRKEPADFVHPLLTVATWKRQYARCMPIQPVPMVNDRQPELDLAPPDEDAQRGRPKKKRIPSTLSDQPGKKRTCGRCGALGHNKLTCKQPLSSQQQLSQQT